MDEKAVLKLIRHVQSHSSDVEIIQASFEQYDQAIRWAEEQQRWDLVLELTNGLSSHFTYANPLSNEGEQDTTLTSLAKKNFWERGILYAKYGLSAASQAKNPDKQLKFLMTLSQLSGYLHNFEMALNYAKQGLDFVTLDKKGHIARELYLLGNRASNVAQNFLAARACYQMSLEIFEATDNKYAMVDVLAWMAVNEEKLDNPDLAQQFFDRSNKLRNQLNKED